jgi:hypothetical protein
MNRSRGSESAGEFLPMPILSGIAKIIGARRRMDRGCVVLDQPQRVANGMILKNISGSLLLFQPLRLVFDPAALRQLTR